MPANQPDVDAMIALMSLGEKVEMLSGDVEFWDGMNRLINKDYYHNYSFPVAANARLGIPGLKFIDGPRGVVLFGGATTFPVTMARGASWNPELEAAIGDALGKELRLLGGNLTGAVCINLLRHPAWGRAQETYGEDTCHLGAMGAALSRGIQRHAIACVKHYALNSMENARFSVDVEIDDRSLHEVYLPHFKDCIDAGAQSVMSAYNSVNGEWAGQNRQLLQDILKDRWGFSGFVITDWIFGVRDGANAIRNGLDLEMPFPMVWGPKLQRLVTSGAVDEALLDGALRRAIAPQFQLPPIEEYDRDLLGCEAHRQLAREAAVQSITLLKNADSDGQPALPLAPWADIVLLGSMADRAVLGDRGSSDGRPDYAISPLAGLQAAGRGKIAHFASLDADGAAAAVEGCDAVLIVVGNDYRDEGEYIAPLTSLSGLAALFPVMPKLRWLFDNALMRPVWSRLVQRMIGMVACRQASKLEGAQASFGRGGDRTSLRLKPADEALIQAACQAHDWVIVALVGGSAIMMEAWRQHPAAILMYWYAGQEGGHALADILFGKHNPSGHLPFSIPADEAHLPHFDKDAESIRYDLWHGYRKLMREGNEPAFPFGFGLSYTEFAIDGIAADQESYADDETVELDITVANQGECDGAMVIQIYASAPDSVIARAPQELRAFAKVALKAGEQNTVRIAMPIAKLGYFDVERDDFAVEPGRYILSAAQYAGDRDGQTVAIRVLQ